MDCPFSKKKILPLILFALIALLLGIGFNTWQTRKQQINLPVSATPINQPQALPEFSLKDEANRPFTNDSLKDHYSFLFFGYTHCQGICPMTMTLFAHLYSQLEKQKLSLPQIVFITLDPKRDTQKVLANYVHAFNPTFKGVTGPTMGIQQFSKQMGVVYMLTKHAERNNKNYQIDHSGTLYLIAPTGKLIAVFSPPHEKDMIVQDYKSLTQT